MKTSNFHRSLKIAALCAAVAAPLTAVAAPSSSSGTSSAGGSGHVSNGGFGAAPQPGAGTLMRPSGGGPSMRPLGGDTLIRPSGGTPRRSLGGDPSTREPVANAAASSDRKKWRYIRPNNDSMLLGTHAPCNIALWPLWLHPALAANVYGPILTSCRWQSQPLWLP